MKKNINMREKATKNLYLCLSDTHKLTPEEHKQVFFSRNSGVHLLFAVMFIMAHGKSFRKDIGNITNHTDKAEIYGNLTYLINYLIISML